MDGFTLCFLKTNIQFGEPVLEVVQHLASGSGCFAQTSNAPFSGAESSSQSFE